MKLKIIFPIIVIVSLAGAAFIGITSVHAQLSGSQSTGLVQLLAAKFNLNTADVQSVFDQYRANQKSLRNQAYTRMLDQAVTDGKITSFQEQLILAKHQELLADRQTTLQDLKNWAGQNNIDLKYLYGGLGHGPRGMRGHLGTSLPTPTP